jgi:hypothetical protein
MRFIIRLVAVAWCAVAPFNTGPASAEKRVALVIGNAAYKVGPLQNPERDAVAVAEALQRKLGFDRVILRKNLGFIEFRAALMEFSREVAGADLGAFYFAGHGTEVGGRNFLIPVDATLSSPAALDVEAIALDTVLSQLSGVRRLKLVILDACRNNPFALSGAKRSVTRGLARIEPEDNTLIAYAAKDGTTADDGPGRLHSPFTEALLRHIATPRLEINLLFRRVRDDVMKATNHQAQVQQPHVYASLGAQELYLAQGAAIVAAGAPPAPVMTPPQMPVAAAPTGNALSGRWLMNYTCPRETSDPCSKETGARDKTCLPQIGPGVGLGMLSIEQTSTTSAKGTFRDFKSPETLGEGRIVPPDQIYFSWKSTDLANGRSNPERTLTGQVTAPGKMTGSIGLGYKVPCIFTAVRQ